MASGSGSDIYIEKDQIDGSVSVDVSEQLKSTLNSKRGIAVSPLPFTCCIFRVPDVLRRQKEEAYEPDIVSIGPIHRGAAAKFELVENVKEWYLKCLLDRMKGAITLKSLIGGIKELEKEARGCYSNSCKHLDQNDFIEMLLLDGCFLTELFRKVNDVNLIQVDNDDPIFNAPCMREYLYHDLMCLENQLPWSVLEFFYNEIECDPEAPPLSKLVINFFRDSVAERSIFSDPEPGSPETLHILDLIRTSLVQGYEEPAKEWTIPLPRTMPQRIPSAATLSEAGVEFRKPKQAAGCILNITFEKGVFTIPALAIDERTDPLFRNLMAYEQFYHSCKHMITSYAVLMANLIDTAKDVHLLCEKEIVANWLSADDASKFFKDLYNNTTVIKFVYEDLCTDVNEYHKVNQKPRIGWTREVERIYYDSPWSIIISVVAAFVLLVLTLLQTIYTIKSS